MTQVLRPQTEAELAAVIRTAAGPLCIAGGGSRLPPVGRRGQVLETGGLTGITLYEPGALTLVARAGTPLAEVEAALAGERQRLAFEPADLRALLATGGIPTIGGVVATNASGPRRIQAGAARDSLIGVRFVDGTGLLVKNGGRVMKNVTGLDLARLMAGAHGTLGVMSEVAFKVLPVPEAAATLVLRSLSVAAAVAAMAAAMGAPYDVTGAAHVDGETLLRVEGFAASVTYRAAALRSVLAGFGDAGIEAGPDAVAARWQRVRDVAAFAGRPGDVWRLSVKPSDAPGVLARIGAEAVVLDWAGGLIWALMPDGADLRARLGPGNGAAPAAFHGHATLVRASADTTARLPRFHPEAAAVAAIAAGLRAKFDPRGILNPGLMG